ncbi:MAG: NAD(P)-binding domain-containing protein [Verrucomicrobiota bacterium]
MNPISKYTRWLHSKWPAGTIEKLPLAGEDGETNISGIRVSGDLTGIPLLKFSADTGARAVRAFLKDSGFKPTRDSSDETLDLAIIGGGVSGIAAAREARENGLHFTVFEAQETFSTIRNFPKGKPIFTYPTDMEPTGGMHFRSEVKEALVDELVEQQDEAGIVPVIARIESIKKKGDIFLLNRPEADPLKARAVLIAIGRSGNHRKMNVPGEEKDKVFNRLHDPKEYCEQEVLIVGGGDSAVEAAIALTVCGSNVTLSYRKESLTRPKPENLEKIYALVANPDADVGVDEPGSERVTTSAARWMRGANPAGKLTLRLNTEPTEIRDDSVVLKDRASGDEEAVANDVVFSMIGREPPLDFFRRSGLKVFGDRGVKFWLGLVGVLAFMAFLYHLKAYKTFLGLDNTNLWQIFSSKNWFPFNIPKLGQEGGALHTILHAASTDPGFLFAFTYTAIIVIFGVRRIRRRKTPYVTWQTLTLMAIQVVPLFLLPYVLFPILYQQGVFTSGGVGEWFGMTFLSDGQGGEPNQFWRAFGFILAWPLFIYNIFTEAPIWGWIILGFIQTFVIIPLIIRRWGKGAYCGWICSCGAMAETLGDKHRHKMPHGPKWNKVNMVGQVILAIAFLLLILRIIGWATPWDGFDKAVTGFIDKNELLSYKVLVDLWLAGAIGYGLYFHFSGRVWCRFACPLAALMHIYARFSKFRIFAEKKKCISCNVCTSVCHQGIDIMNFANKGIPMEDPECVRCSACVQSCPTGVLTFGHYDKEMKPVYDLLSASPVRMRED